jgi:hypothetical protein
VGDDHDVSLGALVGEVLARRPHPDAEIRERLAALGRERHVGGPGRPQVGGHVPQRRAVQHAVVDLDPTLVHGDGEAERLGRLAGAQQRAAHDP